MHSFHRTLLAAAALCVLTGSSALADPDKAHPSIAPSPGGNAYGINGKGGSAGAPGPIAGAGLPFLLMAGGYVLVRRYRGRRVGEQSMKGG